MKIELFAMERMQSTWENQVAFNLSESGVHPMRVARSWAVWSPPRTDTWEPRRSMHCLQEQGYRMTISFSRFWALENLSSTKST